MNLIFPKHDSGLGIYGLAKRISSRQEWQRAKDEGKRMVEWLDASNGHFEGNHHTGWAIAHGQVDEHPLCLFVVNRDLIGAKEEGMNETNALFPARVIFNPEILEQPLRSVSKIPTREEKDGKVVLSMIERELYNIVNVPEGCMSFPHRTSKTVGRFFRIKVRYQYVGALGFVRSKTEWVEGLKAHIFQHECDHMNGKNIYFTS